MSSSPRLAVDAELHGRLATPRLRLRPLVADDLDALHTLLVEPGVRRHLCDGEVLPRPDVEAMLALHLRRHAEFGEGLWAIFEKDAASEAPLGIAGLWPFQHPFDTQPVAELLFALAEAHWGRGLATEAGGAILDHARDVLLHRTARASTNLGNNASIRTLWRLGFGESRIIHTATGPLRLFERLL